MSETEVSDEILSLQYSIPIGISLYEEQVGGGAPGSNGNPGSPDEETKRKEEEKKFHEILVG